MKIIGIIPARMESSRLPGKPLINIGGKSMIRRVYESVVNSKQLSSVYVATPNKEIFDHVKEFGDVILTSNKPLNGTERVYEAYKKLKIDYDFIINIQGDEPMIDIEDIKRLYKMAIRNRSDIATLACKIKDKNIFNKNNIVKVITDEKISIKNINFIN